MFNKEMCTHKKMTLCYSFQSQKENDGKKNQLYQFYLDANKTAGEKATR